MRSPILALLLFCASAIFAQTPETPAAPDPGDASAAEAETRNSALELVGAFSNDGYKIRDGFWFSELEPGKSALIQVNLFAGNEYWFCAASNSSEAKVDVTVYDQSGSPVEQQSYPDGSRFAAGIVAEKSGPYFVKVQLAARQKSPFCLVYCYK